MVEVESVMVNITYKKANQSDVTRLVELRKQQLHDEGAEAACDITDSLTYFYNRHLSDGTFVSWVAVIGEEIIATSGMSFTEKPPYYNNPNGRIGILSNMYTVLAYRRRGIAKKLLELVVKEAKNYGCGVIHLTASNEGALLYEDFGFERNDNFFQYKLKQSNTAPKQFQYGINTGNFTYCEATLSNLERRWDKNITDNIGDNRWVDWKSEYIKMNQNSMCKTFVVLHGDEPIGEGTLLFSSDCNAICGRTHLANNTDTANINALRIDKPYEGNGHISKLVKHMEEYAKTNGNKRLTVGVEASETRNLAIYLHWGYNTLIHSEVEDGELVLYYAKDL